MQDFRNIKVWQRAHHLALWTYRISTDFPRDEVFGLRHSMRKHAVEVPAFIAEGSAKGDDGEYARALGAAVANAAKLEYFALMARDLEFISPEVYDQFERELIEVKKMINGFKRTLNSSNSPAAYREIR